MRASSDEQVVAPWRHDERSDLVAQPVEAGGPAALAALAQRGGQQAGLLELGEMHAGHVGVQLEALGDVGHGDLGAGSLDDGAVDPIAGAVGEDGGEPVFLVHGCPFVPGAHRI